MSYIKDETPYRDVCIPGTHNSGAVGCTIFGNSDLPLPVLDCQQGTIYDQLCYGVRNLDFRINEIDGVVYFAHGTGVGLTFESGMRDIKRFTDEHPGEFLTFSIGLYNSDYCSADAARVKALTDILEPQLYALPQEYDLSRMTMGDIRATGKRYAVNTSPQWCAVINSADRGDSGTWSAEYNFGELEDGERCYYYMLCEIIKADDDERICSR